VSQEDLPEDSFISHLVELRQRLLKAACAVLGIFVVLFIYPGASTIYDLLAEPMLATLPQGTRMIATGVVTPFMVPVKVTLLASFILALPIVLYQAWAFVAPGLYRHEQRLALPLIVSSSLLFLAGMAFCYFVVFRTVFQFIASFAPESITPAPDIAAYVDFVLTMFLAFGITFEVPVAVVLLVKTGNRLAREAAGRPRLRHRRGIRDRGGGHAARRHQPVPAGRALVPALRSRLAVRPHGAACPKRRRGIRRHRPGRAQRQRSALRPRRAAHSATASAANM